MASGHENADLLLSDDDQPAAMLSIPRDEASAAEFSARLAGPPRLGTMTMMSSSSSSTPDASVSNDNKAGIWRPYRFENSEDYALLRVDGEAEGAGGGAAQAAAPCAAACRAGRASRCCRTRRRALASCCAATVVLLAATALVVLYAVVPSVIQAHINAADFEILHVNLAKASPLGNDVTATIDMEVRAMTAPVRFDRVEAAPGACTLAYDGKKFASATLNTFAIRGPPAGSSVVPAVETSTVARMTVTDVAQFTAFAGFAMRHKHVQEFAEHFHTLGLRAQSGAQTRTGPSAP